MTKQSLLRTAAVAALMAGMLAGCGGGGGAGPAVADEGAAPQLPPVVQTPVAPAPIPNDVIAVCGDCGAVGNTYTGAGTGVWEKSNSQGAEQDVPVGISGLNGQNVTLVITNETAADVAFPAIRTQSTAASRKQALLQAFPATEKTHRISEFNRVGWAKSVEQARSSGARRAVVAQKAKSWVVGAKRTFNNDADDARATTLVAQASTSDNTTVNVWVEDAEFNDAKVSQPIALILAAKFTQADGVYDMLKTVGGPLWGEHNYPAELIAAADQPIDIVILNFDRNMQPYGMLGYFWAVNAMQKTVEPQSNESVSLYMDAETLYLDGPAGVETIVTTLAHEGMHMSNFYRRGAKVSPENLFETWLEEMTAMMMEDAASSALTPGYNPTRDIRMPQYLGLASYNCPLTGFYTGGNCEAYATAGTFGGFVLRQLGIDFYKNLLSTPNEDSVAALQNAIKTTRPDSSLALELRRFGATTIGGMPGNAPQGYGFPARAEQGFDISAIAPSQYPRGMLVASPATLKAYGHFAVVRPGVRGTFSETVRVPAGATLSVVIVGADD